MLADEGALLIERVRESDSGRYTCAASNAATGERRASPYSTHLIVSGSSAFLLLSHKEQEAYDLLASRIEYISICLIYSYSSTTHMAQRNGLNS